MVSLLDELTSIVSKAFTEQGLDSKFGQVVVSQRPDLCQFQCNGALAAAKAASKNPRELAESIASTVGNHQMVSSIEVAGPGFLNINVEPTTIAELSNQMLEHPKLGMPEIKPTKVIIDYGGANVAKSLHVGHLRPAVIGESLKRIYNFAGYEAVGDVHLGDWGLPMGQLIAAIEEASPELAYFDAEATEFPTDSPVTMADLEKIYPEASTKSKQDKEFAEKAQQATVALQEGHKGYEALWSHFRDVSVEALGETYTKLGVEFELWLGEASVAPRLEKMLQELLDSGVAIDSDGALIIKVAEDSDTQEVPPLMMLNSRGGLTYATTDLATIDERIKDFGVNKMVYVVDNRQSLHFLQVFRAARKAGIAGDDVEMIHAPNGTVNGPDGKPLKTRDGNLPRLNDLIDESHKLAMQQLDENNLAADFEQSERSEIAKLVGLAALNYGELSNHRTTNYNFDLARFTQLKGQTGPYLQYVAVRAQSTLQKAADKGFKPRSITAAAHEAETKLLLALLQLPERVNDAIQTNAPNSLAEYTYEVAASFNQFYDACHILSEESESQRESWLAVVQLARTTLEQLLNLLVIQIPKRM